MQNTHHELSAVDLLLLADLIALEATTVVVVALVALVFTVARCSPQRVAVAPTPTGLVLAPFAHPLVAVAGEAPGPQLLFYGTRILPSRSATGQSPWNKGHSHVRLEIWHGG
jgi:hypothetical protein